MVLVDGQDEHIIRDQVTFYIPNYEKSDVQTHAVKDTEFLIVHAHQDSDDIERRVSAIMHLPYCFTESRAFPFEQDYGSQAVTVRPFIIATSDADGRLYLTTCRLDEITGPLVQKTAGFHQWNYFLSGTECTYTVENEGKIRTYTVHAGDFNYIPYGAKYTIGRGGDKLHCVRIEFNAHKVGV